MITDLGYVLHSTPYRETSLVVDVFTRSLGRIGVVAKGARRPLSALRPVLLQFQPLECRVLGKGELRTLARAEWQGGLAMPAGQALLFAFYLNELLVRLLPRDDPHPVLFDAYTEALAALGTIGAREEVLRRFEWQLLEATGYAPDLTVDDQGRQIESDGRYRIQEGQLVAADGATGDTYSGQALRDIAAGRYDVPAHLAQAKRLSRQALGPQLDGVPLKTRQILIDLQKL